MNIDLTHEDLGKLVGATRQSVSDALGQLAGRELLVRRKDKSWLLAPHAPDEIEHLVPPRPRRRSRS